jgi:HEPN domain-containing protein
MWLNLPTHKFGGLMNRDLHYGISEQAKASRHRLDDARVLFNAVRWRGAMYMAGYAVECLLKTKLMHLYNCRHLRELEDELQRRGVLPTHGTVFTHQLEALLKLTQGLERLRQNQSLWLMFNTVNRWVPAWRYTANPVNSEDANDVMNAVERIMHWIEHNI